ncbi:alpha/beta fold hydrolase [Falsiroseomonas tokyonensis]|uniref:Alpha/beta fold hydrolase n=1 Tax=Falsiroseomonas tokyonensis TaxID=430521 RepID=A0ABV7BYA8_9PROT|nr:alpha/beta hydrolase [Falsiroseomonas tokyonensis]MBU8538901.1 alpha/beta fold hydrolase [Falsiroseomonas tokyonensis]
MPWIATPEIALRYEISGEGQAILMLLHEMGGSLESWEPVLPLLHPHFRVLRYDQRNAGLSEKPPGPMTLAQSGNDAVALLDALGLTEPVVVLGTAVGGAVALHLAAAHPGRIRAAIVTSPATGLPEAGRAAAIERADLLEREGTRAVVDAGLAQSYPEALRGDAARFAATRA